MRARRLSSREPQINAVTAIRNVVISWYIHLKIPVIALHLNYLKMGMYQPNNASGPNVFRRVRSSKCARKIEAEETQKDATGKVTSKGLQTWYFRSTGSSPGDHFKWSCTQSDGAKARKAKIDAGQPLTAQEQRMEDKCKRVGADCGF